MSESQIHNLFTINSLCSAILCSKKNMFKQILKNHLAKKLNFRDVNNLVLLGQYSILRCCFTVQNVFKYILTNLNSEWGKFLSNTNPSISIQSQLVATYSTTAYPIVCLSILSVQLGLCDLILLKVLFSVRLQPNPSLKPSHPILTWGYLV